MPIDILWGATEWTGITVPASPLDYVFLALEALLVLTVLYRGRRAFRSLSWRRWLALLFLAAVSFVCSQLLPIPFLLNDSLTPLAHAPATPVNLLAAVPYLLAGAIFQPAAALVVGFAGGVGRALGQTHSLFTPLHVALAAAVAGVMLQQVGRERLARWLRSPLLAGPAAQMVLLLLMTLTAFVTTIAAPLLVAIDVAVATLQFNFWPLLLEGLAGGVIVALLLRAMPQLRPTAVAPIAHSIQRYMLSRFLFFMGGVLLLTGLVIFAVTAAVSAQSLLVQMAYSSDATAAQLATWHDDLEALLRGSLADGSLSRSERGSASALGAVYRTAASFDQVLLVDEGGAVASAFPTTAAAPRLTAAEATAVARALERGQSVTAVTPAVDGPALTTLVVPATAEDDAVALLGRVQPEALAQRFAPLPAARAGAYLVDAQAVPLAGLGARDPLGALYPPAAADAFSALLPAGFAGQAYLAPNAATGGRELIYVAPVAVGNWRVVTAVPYGMVFGRALLVTLGLLLLLGVLTAVFYARLAAFGRSVSQPLTRLAGAARTIAAGGEVTTPLRTDRSDEVGELGRAFSEMQRALKQRLDELSLLLGVSQNVTTSININQSLPAVLQGALRGTSATGARAVILNPSGGYPLAFGEGPTAERMATLDRAVMAGLRQVNELALTNPAELRAQLDLADAAELSVQAIFAAPLFSPNGFQGVIFLGYPQPHTFTQSERDLLHTLVGQAAVLVDNAHLFANAESGRRRLAAVLASTADAVIVTDQTERILLVNRAMETAFQFRASEVKGRPVADVFASQQLVRALTREETDTRDLEIRGRDMRTYYANVSTIVSRQNQVLGRVAVLHDVTHLKEVDRMKSEFVSSVSHDLRTPLTIMHGYASILSMMEELTEEQATYVDKILQQIDQMTNLIGNLLDLGRIEAGVDIHPEAVDVQELLQELKQEHWQHAHLSGVSLEVEAPESLPRIWVDRPLMRQAIINLMVNAFKYAPNSGVVCLGATAANGEMVISVADDGPGIAKQDQMHLFEKFYRVKPQGGETVKGSGLGLSIVKSIAERHGGQVWCKSQLGQGSTFYISVPLNGPETAARN